MSYEKTNIKFVQMFRGIAAILVVLYHGRDVIGGNDGGTVANILFMSGGSMGVDLFFLISGFIMVCTTWDADGSLKYAIEFYIKRLSRIVPVFAVLTTTVFVLAFFSQYTANFSSLAKALVFMPQGDLAAGPIYGQLPLSVGWTLNYEMYFYLIFGGSLLFRRQRWLVLLAGMIITLVIFPWITRGTFSSDVYGKYSYSIVYLNVVTNPIIWLFLAGVGIGLAYKSPLIIRSKFWCGIAAGTATTCLIWQYLSQFHVDHGIFMWGLSLVPLMLVLTVASKTIEIPTHPVLIWLGNISFSLYLIHVPIKAALENLVILIGAKPSGISFFVAATFFAIVGAAISHRYLEQTLANNIRQRMMLLFDAYSERRRRLA